MDDVQLKHVQGLWVDESVPVPARVQLNDFAMTASKIAWPFKEPFAFQGESGLSGDKGVPSTGHIVFSGKATDRTAEVEVKTTALPLQLGASYLTGVIEPGVQGTIDSEMQLHWLGEAVQLKLAQLTVSDVALQCNSKANCAAPHGTAVGLKGKDHLLELQQLVQQVHAAEPLLNYLQDLLAATRSGRWFLQGLSPRAGIAIMRAAKAQAFMSGRDYVAPDDIAAILPQTAAHRLIPVSDAGRGAVEQVRAMLDAVPLP